MNLAASKLAPAHREELSSEIIHRLMAGLPEDVWIATSEEDWTKARHLGQQLSDLLCLLTQDLGWGMGSDGPTSLSTPSDVISRCAVHLDNGGKYAQTEGLGKYLACSDTSVVSASEQSSTLTIELSALERDFIQGEIAARLTGLDEISLSVKRSEWREAQRLGVEFSDFLRLLNDGLGWQTHTDEGAVVTTDSAVLVRALPRVHSILSGRILPIAEEAAETTAELHGALAAQAACAEALDAAQAFDSDEQPLDSLA